MNDNDILYDYFPETIRIYDRANKRTLNEQDLMVYIAAKILMITKDKCYEFLHNKDYETLAKLFVALECHIPQKKED